jgi:hypothetical protein
VSGSSFLLLLHAQESLIAAARRLVEQGDTGPAVVVAETAVEYEVGGVLSRYLRAAGVSPDVTELVVQSLPRTPDSARLLKAFKLITGHPLTDAPGWSEYQRLLPLRHSFVHRAEAVGRQDADAFIDAADQVSQYVAKFAEGV